MPGPPHPPPLRSSPRAPHEPGRRPDLLRRSSPGEGENLRNLVRYRCRGREGLGGVGCSRGAQHGGVLNSGRCKNDSGTEDGGRRTGARWSSCLSVFKYFDDEERLCAGEMGRAFLEAHSESWTPLVGKRRRAAGGERGMEIGGAMGQMTECRQFSMMMVMREGVWARRGLKIEASRTRARRVGPGVRAPSSVDGR